MTYRRSYQPAASTETGTRGEIKRLVRLLGLGFGRRLDDELVEHWANRLEPFAGRALVEALHDAGEGERFPTLNAIMALYRQKAGRMQQLTLPEHKPTEAQQKRTDHAAILSMLWLHYEKPGSFHIFGDMLTRLFGGDPHAALLRATHIYDRATVAKWMQDQERCGN